MKITTIRLLHAARDWNTKTTNRVTLWINGRINFAKSFDFVHCYEVGIITNMKALLNVLA
jgi:hypothetical protein